MEPTIEWRLIAWTNFLLRNWDPRSVWTTQPATSPRRSAALGLALQLPGLVLIGLALYYVGIRNIAGGNEETMWILVLVGYTLGSAVAIWLLQEGIREARH